MEGRQHGALLTGFLGMGGGQRPRFPLQKAFPNAGLP